MIEEKNSFYKEGTEDPNQSYKDVNAMINANSKKDTLHGYSDSITNVMPSLDELLQKTIAIFSNGFIKFSILAFFPAVLIFLLAGIVLLGGGIFQYSLGNIETIMPLIIIIGIVLLIGIIYFSLLIQSATYLLIKDFSKTPTIKELLIEAKKHIVPVFWINLLTCILVCLWSLLFIIPGIIMGIRYSMAIWVYFYEGLTGKNAINRSSELIKGFWWAYAGRVIIIYIIYIITMLILGFLIEMPNIVALKNLWGIINGIMNILFGQFTLIYSCFLYWGLIKVKGNTKF